MEDVLTNGFMKRRFAHEDKPVQTFGLYAAYKALGIGI
jgi:hypothetical protein